MAIVCGGGKDTNSQVQNPDPPTTLPPAATEPISPTLAPAETPTLEPPPTATPESKNEAPCEILPQEYCSQAEIIELDYQGVTYKNIGFHLPAGVPLFSPMDGNLAKTKVSEPSHLHGFLAAVNNANDPTLLAFAFYGDLGFDNMLSSNVNEGGVIGYTQDTGIKGLGDYNIVLQVTRLNSTNDGFVTDEELLRRMFPQAFEKPAKKTVFDGQGAITFIPSYNNE